MDQKNNFNLDLYMLLLFYNFILFMLLKKKWDCKLVGYKKDTCFSFVKN